MSYKLTRENRGPINTMKFIFVISLVAAVCAYTPINKRNWINFRKVKDPTYVTVPINEEVTIIHAKQIDIVQQINTVAVMVHKSMQDFHKHMQKYTTDVTEHVKRATQKTTEYGFVRRLV